MKHTRTSFRPVTAIAAILTAGALLASCSSSTDGDAADSTAATSSSTTSASASSAADAPAGSIDAELKQAATNYLDAINTGKVDAILAASCQKVADELPEGTPDGEPLEQPIVVDKVENVVVDGDNATADVTASLKDAPDVAPQTESLMFANENGWKVCQ